MTHEEYLSQCEAFADSDASAVLAHVDSCAVCRRDERLSERALSRLEPEEHSVAEEITRWAAIAAFLAVVAFGLRPQAVSPAPESTARYRIVGDASGVVAYTPGGIVVGTAARQAEKEIAR
jgi:hypothetical protein